MVTMACVVLHNYLLKKLPTYANSPGLKDEEGVDGDVIPGAWRQVVTPQMCIQGNKNNHAATEAVKVRDSYAKYFMTVGAVSFQNKMARSGYR